jgi:hypothetical protein
MKLGNTSKTNKSEWHESFALIPHRTIEGDWVWWEKIWRKQEIGLASTSTYLYYRYKRKQKTTASTGPR